MKIMVVPSASATVLPNGKCVQKSIVLNNTLLMVLGAFIFTWIGSASYLLGYQVAAEHPELPSANQIAAAAATTIDNPEAIKAWQQTLTTQNQQLQTAIKNSQDYLKKITQQVAELQSRQTRVEALASALSKDAQLSDIFDFSHKPGVGGPDDNIDSRVDAEDLPQQLAKLDADISHSADQLNRFASYFNQKHSANHFVKTPPINNGWLSSDFGMRRDPFTGRQALHLGLDFAGKSGSAIVAVAAGKITFVGQRSGYGNVIEITHDQGLVTRYAHCQKLLGKVGDLVKAEQIIATMGSTGRSTGPHVHFEVLKNNQQVNPNQYFRTSPTRANIRKLS
jgi:hypothetical protein